MVHGRYNNSNGKLGTITYLSILSLNSLLKIGRGIPGVNNLITTNQIPNIRKTATLININR
jgi:hypothetical protein